MHALFSSSFLPLYKRADLGNGVTDEGVCALAFTGCGKKLTSLHLACALCDCDLDWCGVAEGGCANVTLFSSSLLFCNAQGLGRE